MRLGVISSLRIRRVTLCKSFSFAQFWKGIVILPANGSSNGSSFPTRRELREQTGKPRNPKISRPSWLSLLKGGLVAVVAAATVAVPITGFVGPETSIALPSKMIASPATQSSWAKNTDVVVSEAEGLRQVAGAASRAKLRTPLEISQCLEGMPANGNRSVSESAPIVWPLLEGTFNIASPFGYRFHPVLGYSKLHEGLDLAGPIGTPIFAASDGVVQASEPMAGYGYWILIKHTKPGGEVFYTGYAHMFAEDVLVKAGDQVHAGQRIASVGNTGTSTGPHLHFEVHDKDDQLVDPMVWLQENNARQPGQGCD
ncbi:hypothetical protein HMPREF9238_00522 [Gleimia europaea ACS-120-V-Col10b]|uniref:M23ase beta-sheet core domain-containing protein n=1 Tax=Gleimia europaea ACS-120-V-Col10b TaxID=883069 RepID=A0A9W5RE99_9ACTO|nr:hypothetical protein HMPREF9238_00522 [Gleimia europaea ACS-120-V-Col10b]